MKRIVTGILLIAAVVSLVLWCPPYLVIPIQLAIALLAVREFFLLAEGARIRVLRLPGYTFAILLSLASVFAANQAFVDAFDRRSGQRFTYVQVFLDPMAVAISAICLTFLVVLMVAAMSKSRGLQDYLGSVAVSFFGPIYVAVPLLMLVTVLVREDGAFHVLFALVVIWAGDTAGYFIGKNFGKHRSSPRISPNKTWEGTIASFVAALLVGVITARYFWGTSEGINGYVEPTLLAAALNIAGQFGDLAESALKRSAGVKDSSNLIPGHGGVLDRIDALLFAAPVLWYYWLWHTG